MTSRAAAWILLLLVGCSKPLSIKTVGIDELDLLLSDHRGEISVVPVWATWCRTCLELLPEIIALQQNESYGDVAFLTVTLDDSDDAESMAEALAIVLEHEAAFPHYALQAGIEQALARLGIDDVPAVLVYDQEGTLRYRLVGDPFDNKISPPDVEDAIDSLR